MYSVLLSVTLPAHVVNGSQWMEDIRCFNSCTLKPIVHSDMAVLLNNVTFFVTIFEHHRSMAEILWQLFNRVNLNSL